MWKCDSGGRASRNSGAALGRMLAEGAREQGMGSVCGGATRGAPIVCRMKRTHRQWARKVWGYGKQSPEALFSKHAWYGCGLGQRSRLWGKRRQRRQMHAGALLERRKASWRGNAGGTEGAARVVAAMCANKRNGGPERQGRCKRVGGMDGRRNSTAHTAWGRPTLVCYNRAEIRQT